MTATLPITQDLRVSLLHVERSSYRTLDLREGRHPYWALSLVSAGSAVTVCRGVRYPVPAGSLMVHPPDLPYSELASVPGTHEWLLLDAHLAPGVELLRLHPVAPVVALRAQLAPWRDLFADLLRAWHSPVTRMPFRSLLLAAKTTELLATTLAAWQEQGAIPRPAAMDTGDDRFAALLHFMDLHLADRTLTRERLAARAFLHPTAFDRAFRAVYGQPPMAYLRDLRLRAARSLLETGDEEPIEAVAAACGFASASHLTRRFAVRFEVTPAAHRESVKRARGRYAGAGWPVMGADTIGTPVSEGEDHDATIHDRPGADHLAGPSAL